MDDMLTIDPGMNTGYCYWSGKRPTKWGQFLGKHSSLVPDLEYLFDEFMGLTIPAKVYIEYPGVWQNSEASMASAFSGDLVKLATIVGGYTAFAHSQGAELFLIPPAKWKGQLSKEAVKLRVFRTTGIDLKSSHMNDAIGIGLWVLGRLNIPNQSRPFQ